MRERLLAAFVGLSLLTTLLYGVPRAFIVAEQTRAAVQRDLDRQADAVIGSIDTAERLGSDVDVASLSPGTDPQDGLRYVADEGEEMRVGDPDPGPDDLVAQRRSAAGGTLEIRRDRATVDRRVISAIAPIGLVGLGALAVAVALAWVLARRFARPLQQLADAAQQLGEGQFEFEVPEQGIREAAAIATALRASAARIGDQLRKEQEFASSASHQLRTPLTGLRLRLEGLLGEPGLSNEAREDLRASLAEVDRLSATVAGVLDLARSDAPSPRRPLDLDELLGRTAERWTPTAAGSARSVEVVRGTPLTVAAPDGILEQVLDVLVENALAHGAGPVRLAATDEGGPIRLRVQDHGRGVSSELAHRIFERHVSREGSDGQGIGLALARQLVEALGGRLVLVPGAPTTFDVLLPGSLVESSR
jgi:signal transduction histidine kinase